MPTTLVTGANRGLGLEFVRQYAAAGWQVHAVARKPAEAPALAAIAEGSSGRVTVHELAVTDFAAVDALAARLRGVPIDVLLNVAGTMGSGASGGRMSADRFGESDFEDWQQTFRLNTFAPMRMAQAFAPQVAASGEKKIVALTSTLASITENAIGGLYSYRASKAALNAILKSMSIDLRRRGIAVLALHPGWVRTDMGGPRAELDAATSVSGMREVIAALDAKTSGKFLMYNGVEKPW